MMNLFKKRKDFLQMDVPSVCKSQSEKSHIISETLKILEHKIIINRQYE